MIIDWKNDFGVLYKKQGQHKYGIRLFALYKIQSGMSQISVSLLLGKTQKTINNWLVKYINEGVKGLLEISKGRGRKPNVVLEKKIFSEQVDTLSHERDGGRIRCADIVDMVQDKYSVRYSLPGMYHILHRLGFSWITARSKHPSHDQADQDLFKKTLSLL